MLVVKNNRIDFIFDRKPVGYMIINNSNDYDYCEYIEIYKEYRGMGYAKKAIDEYRIFHKVPFRYSITRVGSSGDKFWSKYCGNRKKIKGLTYEI